MRKYKHFKHTGRMERFLGYPIVTNGDIGVQFRTGVVVVEQCLF